MTKVVDYEALKAGDKQRLTVRLVPDLKAALKRKARDLGVTPSAYVAMLVSQDLRRDGVDIGGEV